MAVVIVTISLIWQGAGRNDPRLDPDAWLTALIVSTRVIEAPTSSLTHGGHAEALHRDSCLINDYSVEFSLL